MDKKKFQSLSFKGKIEWLVQYYGLFAIIGIFVLVMIISMIKSMVTSKEEVLNILIADERFPQMMDYEYKDKMVEALGEGVTSEDVLLSVFNPNDATNMQAFVVRAMVDSIDYMILSEEQMKSMGASEDGNKKAILLDENSAYEKFLKDLSKRMGIEYTTGKMYLIIPDEQAHPEAAEKVKDLIL